jgi:hypothetical protein
MKATKMARFRVDTSRETGEVVLLIETECGFRTVMGWPDTDRLREFAEMLLGICSCIDTRGDNVTEVSDRLLREALGDG